MFDPTFDPNFDPNFDLRRNKEMSDFTSPSAIKAGVDALEQGYERFLTITKERLETVYPAAATGFDQLDDMRRRTIDNMLSAGKTAAHGWDDVSAMLAANQEAMMEGVRAMSQSWFGGGARDALDAVEATLGEMRARMTADVEAMKTDAAELGECGMRKGQAHQPVGHQEARAFAARVVAFDGAGKDQSVEGQHAGTIRHQKARARLRKLRKARDPKSPVAIDQRVEQRAGAPNDIGVETELVDFRRSFDHSQGAQSMAHRIEECLEFAVRGRRIGRAPGRESRIDLDAQLVQHAVEPGNSRAVGGGLPGAAPV